MKFAGASRKMKDLSEIPVIYLSALTDIKDKVMAFEQGGVDYIEKPFQFEEYELVLLHI